MGDEGKTARIATHEIHPNAKSNYARAPEQSTVVR